MKTAIIPAGGKDWNLDRRMICIRMKSGFSVYSLVGRYQDLGFVFWGIWEAFRRCGTRFLFSLFPGCPAAGRDWDRGRGSAQRRPPIQLQWRAKIQSGRS